jgi:hypothetical protein
MHVAVMQIFAVLVVVLERAVLVRVRVLAGMGRIVRVVVVTVVVAVRVIVRERGVHVAMAVVLGQVLGHPEREQQRGPEGAATRFASAQ